MNKARRKELKKAYDLLVEASIIIEQMRAEEQDAFDNLPEGIQYSERGQQMEEYADMLDEIYSNIEDQQSELADVIGF